MRKKTILYFAIIVIAAISFTLDAVRVDAQQAYPTRPVNLVAGSPAGSLDIGARNIEQVLNVEKMLDKPFVIMNKGAGGGNQETAFLVEQKGSGYTIALNSNRVILNYHAGTIEYGLKDVTVVARLSSDFPTWAVRADSKYKTALDVLADMKKDMNSVVWGLSSLFSNNQFNILLPAKEYGLDYAKAKLVALPQSGDLTGQLLGGHIPIISTQMSEILPQVKAGKVRFLTVAAPSRLERFPDVPTWKDLGINVVIPHWMGVFGPPDMPKVAYDYWNKKFAQMVKTKTWKENLEKIDIFDAFLTGEEFAKQLVKEEVTYVDLLRATGQLKR